MMKSISRLTLALTLLAGMAQSFIPQLAAAKAVEGVVNVNTASVQELTMLPGIGKAKAEQIVQMRQAKPLSSVDELKAIKGLGEKRLEALRPHVSFSGATTAKAIKAPKEAAPGAAPATSTTPAGKI